VGKDAIKELIEFSVGHITLCPFSESWRLAIIFALDRLGVKLSDSVQAVEKPKIPTYRQS
jgi:hypothetical protein